jgi:arylsulfatase A-like enzyme
MRTAALHIVALAAVGVAQPVYDLFSRHPDFFVAHASRPADLLWLVGLVSAGVPAAGIGVVALARLAGVRAQRLAAHGVVGTLVAVVGLQILERGGLLPADGLWAVAAAGLLFAVAGAFAVARFQGLRRFLSWLALAAPVFPAIFLLSSPVRSLVFPVTPESRAAPIVDSRVPVVVLILDELPLASLLDEDLRIDARRFPAFARLAAGSHWFRNATTVAERTTLAIPALLTGQYPEGARLATAEDHPQNLFTLFAPTHRFSVFETNSALCPESVCNGELRPPLPGRRRAMLRDAGTASLHVLLPRAFTAGLPDVTQTWSDFGAERAGAEGGDNFRRQVHERRFDSPWLHGRFVDSFAAGGDRTLFFLHLGLPHVPWRYLPSGREYRPAPIFPAGLEPDDRDLWSRDEWAVTQAMQRHLLQVAYADRLLGETLDALQREGLYDGALLAVASDHGVGLQAGDRRRSLTDGNRGEILPVPLFIKRPGQRTGVVSDRNAQTVDLLPSLADVLGFELPEAVDGRSLFGEDSEAGDHKTVFRRLPDKQRYERLELPAAKVADELRQRAAALHARFGSGPADPSLYTIGPHAQWLGSALDELRISDTHPSVGVSLDPPTRQLAALDPSETIVPARITGQLHSSRSEVENLELAVALNGVLRATTRSGRLRDGAVRFSAMVPESSLVRGENRLEVFVLRRDADRLLLEPTWRRE